MKLTGLESRQQQGQKQSLCGGSKGESGSLLIRVLGCWQFHGVVGLRSLFPC